ncbi:MAG: hypothetical protein AB7G88_06820 [Thermomicrobiales bacterium]
MSVLSNRASLTVSGILSGFGEGFILPLIVIAAYVLHLNAGLLTVGAVPAIAFGLRSAGNLAGSRIIRDAQRRKPWAFAAHVLRTGSVALIAWIAWRENVLPEDRLQSFLMTVGVFSFFSGVASSTTSSLGRVATDPAGRVRLYATRAILAAGIGIISGAIIHETFTIENQSIDRSFALLFVVAAAAMAGSAFLVLLVRERPALIPRTATTPGGTPAFARSMSVFRRYIVVRALFAATAAADVFLIVFALRELSFDLEDLGLAAMAFCGSLALGNVFWTLAGPSVLSRSIIQTGAVFRVVPYLIAFSLPLFEESAYYQEHASAGTIARWAIVAAFAALGFAGASIASGGFTFLMSVSTTMAPSFTSMTTAVIAPFSLLAIGGGWAVKEWGFDTLFSAALALSIVTLLSTGFLPVTARKRPQSGAGIAGPAPSMRANRLLSR